MQLTVVLSWHCFYLLEFVESDRSAGSWRREAVSMVLHRLRTQAFTCDDRPSAWSCSLSNGRQQSSKKDGRTSVLRLRTS